MKKTTKNKVTRNEKNALPTVEKSANNARLPIRLHSASTRNTKSAAKPQQQTTQPTTTTAMKQQTSAKRKRTADDAPSASQPPAKKMRNVDQVLTAPQSAPKKKRNPEHVLTAPKKKRSADHVLTAPQSAPKKKGSADHVLTAPQSAPKKKGSTDHVLTAPKKKRSTDHVLTAPQSAPKKKHYANAEATKQRRQYTGKAKLASKKLNILTSSVAIPVGFFPIFDEYKGLPAVRSNKWITPTVNCIAAAFGLETKVLKEIDPTVSSVNSCCDPQGDSNNNNNNNKKNSDCRDVIVRSQAQCLDTGHNLMKTSSLRTRNNCKPNLLRSKVDSNVKTTTRNNNNNVQKVEKNHTASTRKITSAVKRFQCKQIDI